MNNVFQVTILFEIKAFVSKILRMLMIGEFAKLHM